MKIKILVVLGLWLSTLALPASKFESWESDPTVALKLAKKSGKPLLIFFHAIWCPPCNQLEETVFESRPFLEKSRQFHLLQLDADSPVSFRMKSRYKIGGYPTTVFADSKGNEIYRVVGYRDRAEFLKQMDNVLRWKKTPMVKACSSDTVDLLWRCGSVCWEKKDHKCAEKAFLKMKAKAKPGTTPYDEMLTYFSEEAPTEDLKRQEFEKNLAAYPESPRALSWALSYLELFPRGQAVLKPNTEILDKVLAASSKIPEARLVDSGYSLSDLLQMKAEVLSQMGRPEESKAAWLEASKLLEKIASLWGPALRGFTMERVGVLDQAGDLEGALALTRQLTKAYPKEFTFHLKEASLLERLKKYSEAVAPAKIALEESYGDNQIRVATLLIRVYTALGDRKAAQEVYQLAKKQEASASNLDVRTHKYLKQLDKVWQDTEGKG